MSRCLLLSRVLMAALCFFFTSGATNVRAAEVTTAGSTAGQPPSDTVFRRLFVPADAPETWPVGSEQFLPISREEFSRLIDTQETPPTSQLQPTLQVGKAVSQVKLLPGDLLGGTTEWSVELTGKRSKLLPLAPLNLAIQSAFWRHEPTQKASVGLWESEDPSKNSDLELAVLVERSGTFVMHWQMAPQKADSSTAVYNLQKPIVIPQTLELDLPANYTATLSHAQLLRTELGSLGESRWFFQLAPRESHRLRIHRPSPVEKAQALPLVSQVNSYQLEPAGLNLLTQLRLDARESAMTELKAALTGGLRVVEVHIDRQPVVWRVVNDEIAATGEPTLVISRPESHQPQSVEIRCLAKFRPDTRWNLPKLRFNEVAWTEGTTSLLVSSELEVRLLTPRQATLQHIVGIADSAREGEVFRLQEWSREAEIELEVSRPQPRVSAQILTTLELGREEAQASVAATLTNAGSDVYQVQAAVAKGWSIDTVTAIPKSTLNDWHLDHEGNSTKLHIQLNRPISAQRPLRITIKASETTGNSVLPATVGQLKLLRFLEAETTRELLQLRTREPKQLALADHLERARLAPDELPLEFSSLTTDSRLGTLLEISLLDEAEVLEFRQQPAQYEAYLQIEVEASPDSFRQRYQIDCQLRSGIVSELVLEFDDPLPPTIQWTLVGQKGLVTMERLDSAGQESTYVLRFPVARKHDFLLQASYTQPALPLQRCNLLRLPQSLDWRGQVVLRGSLVGLQVLDQGWTPTVASTKQDAIKAAEQRLPLLGAYRIGPEELRRGSTSAGLRLQRQAAALPAEQLPVPQLFAWLAEYHTLQAANGDAIHTAHYSLENLGLSEAQITFPAGAELQEAWLGDQHLDLKQLAVGDNVYQFRFVGELRWPYLALKYSTHKPPLAGSASLQPTVPKSSFPVNLSRWTLWAPEQYEIVDAQQLVSAQSISWWKRLFGPLARSRGETVFNPASRASWTQLWASSLADQPTSQLVDPLETNFDLSADDSRWLRATPIKSPLWNSPVASTLADVSRRAQTVEFVEGLPTLTVRRAFVQRALWYAVVLLTVVLGVWQIAHYPNATLFAGAMAGAACLVVPPHWLTIPQAVFLGLLAATIVRVALRSTQLSSDRSPSLRKVVQTTAIILLCCRPDSPAQAQPSDASANKQNLPRVLVPIDSQGRPQGEDVYLTTEFLNQLQHSPQQVTNDGAKLVLLTANYVGSLPGELEASLTEPWTLRWKVESYVPNARLFLPLRRDEANWIESAHRLDGVPVKLDWRPEGQGCSVTLPETGIHRLQLTAQPRVTRNDRTAKLRLHVPPLPGATLDLTRAPQVDKLQIRGASPTANSGNLEPWHGLLGTQEVLELQWTSKVADNTASWERLEQSAWLHVDPASARLDVQLSLTGYQATSLWLDLDVSAQLKLEPPGPDSPITEVIAPSPGRPNRLRVKLRPGLSPDLVIPLRFELQRAGSVGRIFFPSVRVHGSPPVQNLFAVSVSAGLSYDEKVSNNLRSIEPAEFSRSWNAQSVEPLYAYAMGPEAPDWSLRVWPDPQSLTAQQSLRVHCLPNAVRVNFEAVIDELTGSWLSHRLEVPEALRIDTITVRDTLRDASGANSVPVRWSRVSPTEAVVFLGRPLRHAHLLQLQGHVNATKAPEIDLPQVRLLRGERGEIHLDLYRTEEVQVSWVDLQRAPEEIPEQKIVHRGEEILVGHFSWRTSQASELSPLRLEKNDQKFDTATVTSVQFGSDGWTAQLNSQLAVRQGIVNRLSLKVPDSFQRPFNLQPEQVGVIDEVRETPDGNELILLLSQPAAVGGQVEIQLSGSLSRPADQRLEIPSLAWNSADQRERYVLLPKSVGQQSLRWQTTGLRRQSLPSQLKAYAPTGETAHSFRLEKNQFVAKEHAFRGTLSKAVVRYAKVSGLLDVDGGFTATAELVLQPGRATSCAIQLPPNAQLFQLVVGDRPVRRDRRADSSWKVPIGPPFMPQRIVVNYRFPPERVGDRLRLVPPKILIGEQALPTPQTWWRLRTAQAQQLSQPNVGRLASEIEFVNNSYQQPQIVLQEALSQALDLPREEGRAWAQTWQAITRQAELHHTPSEETQSTFAETFAKAFAIDDTSSANHHGPLNYPPRLPANPQDLRERKERFFVSDSRGQLVLAVSQSSQRNLWRWFAATALLCGTWAIGLRLRRYPNWHYDLCEWPHSLALVGGIAWWWLLNPSAMGILVMVLTLTSMMHKKWLSFRRQSPQEPSSQLAVPAS